MCFYVKIGLFFLMKKISVKGTENIPEFGPLIFMGNHQNALIDAILIPTTTKRNIHFLSRASAFKNKLAAAILRSLNMIPVYRLRDGVDIIEKNQDIFEQCHEFLKQNKAIEIFPEGEHHLTRQILPLKKGFARIILGTLQKYPDLQIKIVPVGLNFDTHLNFPSSVSLIYGEPFLANDYIDLKEPDMTFKAIVKVVDTALKKLTLHIDKDLDYDRTVAWLKANNVNYLDSDGAKDLLSKMDLQKNSVVEKRKVTNWFAPIQWLTKLNSIVPLLVWRYFKGKIIEPIFTNTFRFAVILTIFPLCYMLQGLIVKSLFGLNYGLAYLLCCVLLGIITTKTTPVDQV